MYKFQILWHILFDVSSYFLALMKIFRFVVFLTYRRPFLILAIKKEQDGISRHIFENYGYWATTFILKNKRVCIIYLIYHYYCSFSNYSMYGCDVIWPKSEVGRNHHLQKCWGFRYFDSKTQLKWNWWKIRETETHFK